ncbi:hypothetical protein MBLNU230_g4648t1 [Neophaeotheca triangularis]
MEDAPTTNGTTTSGNPTHQNAPPTTTNPLAPHIPSSQSRRRPPLTGDEEATTTLRLGEFSNIPCLSIAETRELMTVLENQQVNKNRPVSNNDIYIKAREYCKEFGRFGDRETVSQVERISNELAEGAYQGDEGRGLKGFERAQLATLCCDTPEEARTLIPSLEGKISDDDLARALNDISTLRNFS